MDAATTGPAAPPRPKTPIWFWIVAVLAVLWKGMGLWGYVSWQLFTDAYMEALTEPQRALFMAMPTWYVAIWALSVTTAFLGSVGLLIRTKHAVWLFAVALVGFILTCIWSYGVMGSAEAMGTTGIVFSVIIGISLAALLWLSHWAEGRGILR
jgi:amino acid permease